MNDLTVVGLIIAALFFFIASVIDGHFNFQFFSVAILLTIVAIVYFYKIKNTKWLYFKIMIKPVTNSIKRWKGYFNTESRLLKSSRQMTSGAEESGHGEMCFFTA